MDCPGGSPRHQIVPCGKERNLLPFPTVFPLKMRLTYIRCCDIDLDRMLDLRPSQAQMLGIKTVTRRSASSHLCSLLPEFRCRYANRSPKEMGGISFNE